MEKATVAHGGKRDKKRRWYFLLRRFSLRRYVKGGLLGDVQ